MQSNYTKVYLLFLISIFLQSGSLSAENPELPQNSALYIRVFKQEMNLEIWYRAEGERRFSFYRSFEICAKSGDLGPKRKEGDLQIPEGFYSITALDPGNKFYKGLKLNYPNTSDLKLGDAKNPGSDIYIHGSCLSSGCIAMSNEIMDLIYPLAERAINNGQSTIPVHVFPCDFSKKNLLGLLSEKESYAANISLWSVFEAAQRHFSEWRTLPWINTDEKGNYYIIK